MADDVMNFLNGDDLPTYDAWIDAAKSVVTEDLFEELLYTDLGSGIRTEPMYVRQDDPENLSYPTQGINRRASNVTGQLSGWNIRQRYWVNSLEESNAAILHDLQRGTNSIELVLSEVDSNAFEKLLDGVLLNIAGVAPTNSFDSLSNAKSFLEFIESKGKVSEDFIFELSLDPIGELFRNYQDPTSIQSALDAGGALALRVQQEFRKAVTFRVDGLSYAEAGADPITELAGISSSIIGYLQNMDRAGMRLSEAFSQIHVVVSIGTDQFFDIAKIRALRILICRIGQVCGVDHVDLKIQASLPQFLISQSDPWINLLRATVGCFSAATGGADCISLPPFDSAFGIPDDFGMRLARNTQLVLMEESNLHKVIDPAGGSWYVESLTDQIAQKAWERFQLLEENGGIIQEIISGSFQKEILENREQYKEEIKTKGRVLIGVNEFLEPEKTELQRDSYPDPVGMPDALNSQARSTFRISDLSSEEGGSNNDS